MTTSRRAQNESKFRKLVEEVKWGGVTAMDSDWEGTDDSPDTDELGDNIDDHELEKLYLSHDRT